jgi:enoyl-CoA hydratase
LLAQVAKDPTATASIEALQGIYDAFLRVGRLKPPTIAAIAGDAVGAGMNLALATDLRVMAPDAKLISGFLRIGLHPGGGHMSLLARLVGREWAAAAAVFGIPIDGQRAAELGLAAQCCASDEVEARSMELARTAARNPALARAAVSSLRLAVGPPQVPWDVALETERGRQLWSLREFAAK